jgi:hypothetical protein
MNKSFMIRVILLKVGAFLLISFSMCEYFQDLTGGVYNKHTPGLLAPLPGIYFDNGCSDTSDTIQWDFDWSDVPGATRYQMCILHEGSQYLLTDTIVSDSEFRYNSSGGYITDGNRLNWTWMVRAGDETEWWGWSEVRDFTVEPLNTDCK